MDLRTLTNEELINYAFVRDDLTPLEIELLYRVEEAVDCGFEYAPTKPPPGWVKDMFPECYGGDA
jgi:hypothetical protein